MLSGVIFLEVGVADVVIVYGYVWNVFDSEGFGLFFLTEGVGLSGGRAINVGGGFGVCTAVA